MLRLSDRSDSAALAQTLNQSSPLTNHGLVAQDWETLLPVVVQMVEMSKVDFYLILSVVFVVVAIVLGWLGSKPAEGGYVIASRLCTAYYFAHFLIILPLLGIFEKPKPLPSSITESVLGDGKAKGGSSMPAGAAASPETKV